MRKSKITTLQKDHFSGLTLVVRRDFVQIYAGTHIPTYDNPFSLDKCSQHVIVPISIEVTGIEARGTMSVIVKLKTKRRVNVINVLRGYKELEIVEPTML